MSRFKQIIVALVLLVITSIPCLLFVYYQSAQWYIRHEMEEKLENSQLQTIVIPISDVQWYEENKEIIVGGKLFDIRSVVYQDGMASFTGLYDEQETNIKAQLENLELEDDENSKNQSAINLISILLFKEDDLNSSWLINHLSRKYDDYNKNHLLSQDISTPAPPPKA
jgi:hypothetical protein